MSGRVRTISARVVASRVMAHMLRNRLVLALLAAVALLPLPASAQEKVEFHVPSEAIRALVDAPLPPAVLVDPAGTRLVLLDQPGYKSLAELAEPELRLAGLRINPKNHNRARINVTTGVSVQEIAAGGSSSGKRVAVEGLPASPRIQWAKFLAEGELLLVRSLRTGRTFALGRRPRAGEGLAGHAVDRLGGSRLPVPVAPRRVRPPRSRAAVDRGVHRTRRTPRGPDRQGGRGPEGAGAHLPGSSEEQGRRAHVLFLRHDRGPPLLARRRHRKGCRGPRARDPPFGPPVARRALPPRDDDPRPLHVPLPGLPLRLPHGDSRRRRREGRDAGREARAGLDPDCVRRDRNRPETVRLARRRPGDRLLRRGAGRRRPGERRAVPRPPVPPRRAVRRRAARVREDPQPVR